MVGILLLTGCDSDSTVNEPKPTVDTVCYDQIIGGTKIHPETRKVCRDTYFYPDGSRTHGEIYYPKK